MIPYDREVYNDGDFIRDLETGEIYDRSPELNMKPDELEME